MRFGVIVCPRCRCAKGVDLSFQTTKCMRCGKRLTLKKLKVFYTTDSQQQLRQAVGVMNAKAEGNHSAFEKLLRG